MSFSDAHWNVNKTQPKPRVIDKELQRLKTLKAVSKSFQETSLPTLTPSPTASTVSRCYSPVPSETWQSRRSSVYTDDGGSVGTPFRVRSFVDEPMPITPSSTSATITTTTTTNDNNSRNNNNNINNAITTTLQKQSSLYAYELRKQRSFVGEEPLPIVNKQPSLPTHDSIVYKQPSFHQDHIRKQPSFHSEKSSLTNHSQYKKEEDHYHYQQQQQQQQQQQKQQALLEARIAELESELDKTKKELDLEREQHKITKNELEGECSILREKVTQLEDAATRESSMPSPLSLSLSPAPPPPLPTTPSQAIEQTDPSQVKEEEISLAMVARLAPGNNDDRGILEFAHQLDTRLSVSREIDNLRLWEPPKASVDDASIHRRDSGSVDGATFWRGMKKKLRV